MRVSANPLRLMGEGKKVLSGGLNVFYQTLNGETSELIGMKLHPAPTISRRQSSSMVGKSDQANIHPRSQAARFQRRQRMFENDIVRHHQPVKGLSFAEQKVNGLSGGSGIRATVGGPLIAQPHALRCRGVDWIESSLMGLDEREHGLVASIQTEKRDPAASRFGQMPHGLRERLIGVDANERLQRGITHAGPDKDGGQIPLPFRLEVGLRQRHENEVSITVQKIRTLLESARFFFLRLERGHVMKNEVMTKILRLVHRTGPKQIDTLARVKTLPPNTHPKPHVRGIGFQARAGPTFRKKLIRSEQRQPALQAARSLGQWIGNLANINSAAVLARENLQLHQIIQSDPDLIPRNA